MTEIIAGIDLGTTNSEIALFREGRPEVIAWREEMIMPSVVGLDRNGQLLVGTPARNQLAAYPERTIRSIKRKMGSDQPVRMGDREFSPEEISALILRELVQRAEEVSGLEIRKAVITVPAYFRDAQRRATRAAGEIAGLEVVRIINEPTAAALAYTGTRTDRERLLLVYDLGGGTFDASLVMTDGEMTEVLASHGDVHLGGDDFDGLLAEDILRRFTGAGHPDPKGDPLVEARLHEAAEEAKKRLSEEAFTRVREEFFCRTRTGKACHLDEEVSRRKFEELINPLLDRTLGSVGETLGKAGKEIAQVDEIILVGGSTRIPLVRRRLAELHRRPPCQKVDPHLCVAQGAAIQGALLAGAEVARVLVDVTPYSFGISHAVQLEERYHMDCYTPIITAGTSLPATRSQTYGTFVDNQEKIDVRVYQGESPLAQENILVGRFMAEGLTPAPAGDPVICRMTLTLDGLLQVEMIEQKTGLTKKVTIQDAISAYDAETVTASRKKIGHLARTLPEGAGKPPSSPSSRADHPDWAARLRRLLARARKAEAAMAREDREEFRQLAATAEEALAREDAESCRKLAGELEDIVHYAEEA